MATDSNGLILSKTSDSGYRHVTTLFNGPLVGKFIAFADVPVNLQDDCQAYKIQHGRDVFGFKNVIVLGIFDDVRDAAFVGQTFFGKSAINRDANLTALFAGDTSVIPTQIPTWQNAPCAVSIAAGAQRHVSRTTTAKAGKRVPEGTLSSVKVKLSKLYPNATNSQICDAAVKCITEKVTYLSELGLA